MRFSTYLAAVLGIAAGVMLGQSYPLPAAVATTPVTTPEAPVYRQDYRPYTCAHALATGRLLPKECV